MGKLKNRETKRKERKGETQKDGMSGKDKDGKREMEEERKEQIRMEW